LRKGTNLRQVNYNIAQLRFSDHRPVFATFQCTVSIVNEAHREALSREIYERRRAEVGTTTASNQNDDTDDEDLIGYDPIAPGLPPASSDKRKWWLDNGQPARSALQPPQKGFIPNPNRPSNPYIPTDEPDWVTVPRGRETPPPPPKPRRPESNATNGGRSMLDQTSPSKSVVAAITKNFSQTSIQEPTSATKPLIPRTQSALADHRLSTSTTSSNSKKAPPPVARKPVHLAAPSSVTSSPTPSTASVMSTSGSTLALQTPRLAAIDHTGFPPPPRRATTGIGSTYGRRDIEDRRQVATPPPPPQARRSGASRTPGDGTDDGPRPKLPPRRPTDLLGSNDDDAKMSDWEVLRPT
jgi:hypothetical protein